MFSQHCRKCLHKVFPFSSFRKCLLLYFPPLTPAPKERDTLSVSSGVFFFTMTGLYITIFMMPMFTMIFFFTPMIPEYSEKKDKTFPLCNPLFLYTSLSEQHANTKKTITHEMFAWIVFTSTRGFEPPTPRLGAHTSLKIPCK